MANPQKRMTLDNKFEWFLSEEFKDLKSTYRKNFTPLLPEDNIQNCIADNELVEGAFFLRYWQHDVYSTSSSKFGNSKE
jgi:hypothetical protein